MITQRLFRRALASSVVIALAAAGCRDATGPIPLPDDAYEFLPESVYREWWQQMESCSGMHASFDAVRWFVVPGEEPFHVESVDVPVFGYWDKHDNRIVLVEFVPNQRAPLIRHEALHAILRRTDHPALYFTERCGDVIGSPDSPD